MEGDMKKLGLEEGFLDYFNELQDPRGQRNRLYTIAEILLTTLCAAICGAEGWQDVEDYGKIKLECLRQFLPYKNGIPSDDTFRRFFRAIDPTVFQTLFREWVRDIYPILSGTGTSEGVIAIDGKASRHTFDGDTKMLHMVSAYATEARLVLAQEKVSEKSNEITAIPKLLEWLEVKGSTVTIDAMGCQYKIADMIVEKEGAYIFSLKGNQCDLNSDVTLYFTEKTNGFASKLDFYEACDKGHGRIEIRRCSVITDVDWLKKRHSHWSSIQSIICIESSREIKGKVVMETRYYISSLKEKAERILQKIRSHWAIENSLHWILDMSFGEDQSRIRKENAPQVMSVIRHMALNLLQLTKAKMKRQSIKRLRKMAGWDDGILKTILTQDFS
jgi:predicted transposase YbfD/YdcC